MYGQGKGTVALCHLMESGTSHGYTEYLVINEHFLNVCSARYHAGNTAE